MESVRVLIDTLAGLGVEVSLSDAGKVQVHPASRVPSELLVSLKQQREKLQLFLQRETNPATPQPRSGEEKPRQGRETRRGDSAGLSPQNPRNPRRIPAAVAQADRIKDFAELIRVLGRLGVELSLTPAGDLLTPDALPAEVEEAVNRYRALLVRRLKRGENTQGRYHRADWETVGGVCGSCRHWREVSPGNMGGICGMADLHQRTATHQCDLGAWEAKA